jgi:hypothetical protein
MAKLAKPDAASGGNDTATPSDKAFEDVEAESRGYVAHLRALADELEANINENRRVFGRARRLDAPTPNHCGDASCSCGEATAEISRRADQIAGCHVVNLAMTPKNFAELVAAVTLIEDTFAEAEGGDPLPAHETTKIIGEVLAELE